jgi:type IV secretory pathway VirD2 relaxase
VTCNSYLQKVSFGRDGESPMVIPLGMPKRGCNHFLERAKGRCSHFFRRAKGG